MELWLIRHARPVRVENEEGTPADPELSELGQEQARKLADWIEDKRVERLYASTMLRARQTAEPVGKALGLEIKLEPGVAELDRGFHFYIPLEEMKDADPERYREYLQGGMLEMIDFDAFRREVVETLERIVSSHPGERVAVVCHGGVVNAWAGHLLGIAVPMFFIPDYTSVSRFVASSNGIRSLQSLNETGHLRDALR